MDFQPSYIKLLNDGSLIKKIEEAKKHITYCNLCPHECAVDRTKKQAFAKPLIKPWYQAMGLILVKKMSLLVIEDLEQYFLDIVI